jgi:hypothetical protein
MMQEEKIPMGKEKQQIPKEEKHPRQLAQLLQE